jgi:hypothetical protein
MSLPIQKVRRIAKKYGIKSSEIQLSSRPTKKYMFIRSGHPVVHFGAKGMEDYTQHGDRERRARYRARAAGITNKYGEYTYKIKYTSNWFAYHLLW